MLCGALPETTSAHQITRTSGNDQQAAGLFFEEKRKKRYCSICTYVRLTDEATPQKYQFAIKFYCHECFHNFTLYKVMYT